MYNKAISGKTKYGFEMMYYLQTDGTAHGKADKRHVGICTGMKDSENNFHIQPYCDLLLSAPSASKDS